MRRSGTCILDEVEGLERIGRIHLRQVEDLCNPEGVISRKGRAEKRRRVRLEQK